MTSWKWQTSQANRTCLAFLLLGSFWACKPKGPEIVHAQTGTTMEILIAEATAECYPALEMGSFNNLLSFETEASDGQVLKMADFFSTLPPVLQDGETALPEGDFSWIKEKFHTLNGDEFMQGTGFIPTSLCKFPWKGYIDDGHLNLPLAVLIELKQPFVSPPKSASALVKTANRAAVDEDYFQAKENYFGHFATAKTTHNYHFESWNLYRFDPEQQWFLYHNRYHLEYNTKSQLQQALIYRSLVDQKTEYEMGTMEQLYSVQLSCDEHSSPTGLRIHSVQLLAPEVKGEPSRIAVSTDEIELKGQ